MIHQFFPLPFNGSLSGVLRARSRRDRIFQESCHSLTDPRPRPGLLCPPRTDGGDNGWVSFTLEQPTRREGV